MAVHWDPTIQAFVDDSGHLVSSQAPGSQTQTIPDQTPYALSPSQQNWSGFNEQGLSGYFGGMPTAQVDTVLRWAEGLPLTAPEISLLQNWKNTSQAPGPFGATNKLADIQSGLENLAQHPMGSHYHGGFGDVFGKGIGKDFSDLLNVTPFTGFGMFDLSKGRFNAPFSSANILTGEKSLSNVLTAEQLQNKVNSAFSSPEALLQAKVLSGLGTAAAGYGLGSALTAPTVASEVPAAPNLVNQAANTSVYGGYAGGPQLATGVNPFQADPALASELGGASGGAAGALGATGSSSAGGIGGALLASQLAGLSGLFNKQPGMGGPPSGGGGFAGAPTQQQQLAGAGQSELHKGLAPWFRPHIGGQPIGGGIAYMNQQYPY